MSQEKMSQVKMPLDKMSHGQNVTGKNVTGQNATGHNVTWTKCHMLVDKMLQKYTVTNVIKCQRSHPTNYPRANTSIEAQGNDLT